MAQSYDVRVHYCLKYSRTSLLGQPSGHETVETERVLRLMRLQNKEMTRLSICLGQIKKVVITRWLY